MRRAIIMPDDYGRDKLIAILTTWKNELNAYRKHCTIRDLDYYCLWLDVQEIMIRKLKPNGPSDPCFLMFNNDDTLEAIAFCGEINKLNKHNKKESNFHIFDFLVAPWNVKQRLFTSIDVLLLDRFNDIEYRLIKFILSYCKDRVLDYSRVIYDPIDRYYNVFKDLFTKTFLFDGSYRECGSNSDLYVNGFELSQEKLKNTCPAKALCSAVTFFNDGNKVKLFDNYPDDNKKLADEAILKYELR